MKTLLIKNASHIVTMNDEEVELKDTSILCENGIIKWIGNHNDLTEKIDFTIDAQDLVVIPGLVNTHHHLFKN